ncbi:MAG: hypothetical protein GYA62_17415 [Bacteroidales bacterium]|nr:hypothetical protein [Bacteroidales bacterium]
MLNINEVKKHLKRGDLKEIAKQHGFKYSLVVAVLNGYRRNTKVLEALITRAEQNKHKEDELISRTKNL